MYIQAFSIKLHVDLNLVSRVKLVKRKRLTPNRVRVLRREMLRHQCLEA
jgi:hypothetical protein